MNEHPQPGPINCPLRRGTQKTKGSGTSPLWSLGFRVFFLAGAIVALLQMAIWILTFMGVIAGSFYFAPITWHAHEMIFGFIVAITAGFILTAAQNWSGIPGICGRRLQILLLIWIIPRLGFVLTQNHSVFLSALDLSFIPLLAFFLMPYLKGEELKEERVFYIFFTQFFIGNLFTHLPFFLTFNIADRSEQFVSMGIRLGLSATLCMIVFMGGRVIPFFTESNRSPNQPKSSPWVESLSPWSMWVFSASYVFFPESWVHFFASLFAALIQGRRLIGWQVRRTLKAPLIWVLHLAYFWLVLGLVLSAASVFVIVPSRPFIHSFTLGLISTLLLGMMTRVSLGHTGRRLIPQKTAIAGYLFIQSAAIFRVLGPIISPEFLQQNYLFSGLFFIAAFGLFLITYTPILLSPRLEQTR